MIITKEMVKKFNDDFHKSKLNLAVAGAIANKGINNASLNNEQIRKHNFLFSHETKRGQITNQKRSGRCWMFASLNTARIETMKKFNMETIEFSENYTLFWDKLEKSNYFLENILATLDEKIDSRIVCFLLGNVVQDGGQWAMFAGILNKYGIVPKYMMPETFHSSNTEVLVEILSSMLRKDAQILREGYNRGKSIEDLRKLKEEFLSNVYSLLVKALGEPPEKFDFEYKDKDKKFHKDLNLTPQEFFKKYVGWNLEDKVSLINSPINEKSYGRAFTIKFLGTIYEAKRVEHINVPIEVLKDAAIKSIKDGNAVWFGCDVGKMLLSGGENDTKLASGIMDTKIYNYDLIIENMPQFTKAERLLYRESRLTHAMVFTGVDLDENGKPIKWQVENSWGDKVGDKGIYSMSDDWFDEYNYQIMVDKKYVDKKWLAALENEIIELEPWDPMGDLA